MANSSSIQILEDGASRTVIKFEGILDTSDLAATGTIGTAGAPAASGSYTLNFTAGALVPTVGQFVTFSDSTTTYSAGTYITSVVSSTQVLVSNPAKAASTGLTITGTAGAVVIADPATLSTVDPSGSGYLKASKLRIDKIVHNIEDLLSVDMFWNATTPVRIESLEGRGKGDYRDFGGLQNNAGAGVDGKITVAVTDSTSAAWTTNAQLAFSLILYLSKQY